MKCCDRCSFLFSWHHKSCSNLWPQFHSSHLFLLLYRIVSKRPKVIFLQKLMDRKRKGGAAKLQCIVFMTPPIHYLKLKHKSGFLKLWFWKLVLKPQRWGYPCFSRPPQILCKGSTKYKWMNLFRIHSVSKSYKKSRFAIVRVFTFQTRFVKCRVK